MYEAHILSNEMRLDWSETEWQGRRPVALRRAKPRSSRRESVTLCHLSATLPALAFAMNRRLTHL